MSTANGIDVYLRPPLGEFVRRPPFVDDDAGLLRLRRRGFDAPPSLSARSMSTMVSELHDVGIGRMIVPARGGVCTSSVAEIVAEQGDRVMGAGAVRPTPEFVESDVRDCVAAGMVGCFVEPGLHSPPFRLDDQVMDVVYTTVAASGLPLFVLTGGDCGPDLSYVSMVALDRVAARHPELQVVALHGGWPRAMEAVAVALRRPNVWLSPDLFWAGVPGTDVYVSAANGCLMDRMLFGSGYPRANHSQLRAELAAMGLRDAAWEAITTRNPKRLIGED